MTTIATAPRKLAIAAMLAALATGAAAGEVLVDQNSKNVPAFVLMQAEMTDPDIFFQKYAVPAEVEISAHDGRAQVATFGKEVLEGKWDNNWTIMLRFPSLETARTWYHSPGYQAVIPYRHAATAYGNMVLFEGMPESRLNWRVARYDGARPALRFPLTLDTTPEYVVTAAPAWTAPGERFALGASFAQADLRHSQLSVEFKLAAAESAIVTTIALRDAAGHRRTLGELPAARTSAGQWQRVEFDVETRRHRWDDEIDLARVTDVEFEFVNLRRVRGTAAPIQIRNLKLER